MATALMIYATPMKFRIVVCDFPARKRSQGSTEQWFHEQRLNELRLRQRLRPIRALSSARSTVAIRSSIRVPAKRHCEGSSFSSRGRGLVLFFLAALGKTPPQSCDPFLQNAGRAFQNLYPARLAITVPGARQFLRATQTFSAARIFALRDRGLRSISSSLGRHRLLGQQPVPALLRAIAKRILDDPVFERVKADRPPAFRPASALRRRRLQQCFQIVQFTVYEDSESLKGPGRRMNPLMFH
jgi:hypothetical protein